MNKIELKDFLNYNYLSNLKVNDSKTVVSFIRNTADYESDTYKSHLYLKQNEKVSRVHSFTGASSYSWFNDTNILINTSSPDDSKNLTSTYSLYNIENGELEPCLTLKVPAQSIHKISESEFLISVNLNDDDYQLLNKEERSIYLESLGKTKNFEVIEEIPFYFNGGGFTRSKHSQAFIYNKDTDEYLQITDKKSNNHLAYYDKEHNKAYFTHSRIKGVPSFYDSLSVYDTTTRELTSLYIKEDLSISNVIVLNDDLFVMANDLKSHGINQNNNFYKLVGDDFELVAKFGLSDHNSVGSDVRLGGNLSYGYKDGKYYFVGTYADHTRLYQFDGETVTIVYEPQGSIDGFVFTETEMIFVALFEQKLQELYSVDSNFNNQRQITKINTKNLQGKYVAKPDHITYERDGLTLDGWVLLPEDYSLTKKYPAILDIHGGPKTIYNDVYYHEMQLWANMGYIVFFTNPRGGDAYDDAFADIRGKYGTIDYEDIMAFTDIVLEKYSIDEKRIGVTGGSYGGFMTNWIVSHTNRFKAAVTQRSIANWISFYGTSDIGVYFAKDQTDSDPYTSLEKMWEQSPLKHALNIKTPLLLIHSDEDYRCPIEQAMQLFTVIKQNGVETRFIWFKGENHDLSRSGRPQSRVRRLEEITQWFETHLQ